MKKRIIVFMVMCLCLSLQGCKSVNSLLKEGKYEEAYSISKTEEEKLKVINQMLSEGKYEETYSISKTEEEKLKVINQMFSDYKYKEAMGLLGKDYIQLDEEKKKARMDLFIDKLEVNKNVKLYVGRNSIPKVAIDILHKNEEYQKAWAAACMLADDSYALKYIDKLVEEGIWINLKTEFDTKNSETAGQVMRDKYNWISENLIPYLRDFVQSQYISNSRQQEKEMRKNALSSIKSISVMYKTDRYADEYGDRVNIFNTLLTRYHPVMSFCIVNNNFLCDYYGKVDEFYDYNSNAKIERGIRWNLQNVSTYNVNRYIIHTTNMSPILYVNQVTNAYFEVISGDTMVDKAIEYLKNQIK